jgi:hypothetical protein
MQVKKNKLYTIVAGDESKRRPARAKTTKYFRGLKPQEAIAELNAHMNALEKELREYADVDLKVPENLDKAREVSSELEIALDLLRRFKKDHEMLD